MAAQAKLYFLKRGQMMAQGQSLLGSAWQGCYFDGGWRAGPVRIAVTEPATGEILGEVASPAVDDVAAIAERALAAQRGWATMPPPVRATIMRKASAILEAAMPEAAGWVVRETGGAAFKGGFEVQATIEEFHVAAGLLIQSDGVVLQSQDPSRSSIARRVPLGVVGVITPWNVPLGLAIRSVAPALALGNAVILKPDVHTPISGGVLLARVLEEAGVPAGVFSMIPGGADIGEAMCNAPAIRMISFTGSTAAGRRVGELCGRNLKKVALELGGNSPLIVLDDADIDAAAGAGAFGSFFHQGQVCMATSRHIVDRKVADQYIDIITRKAEAIGVGSGTNPANMMGPLINQRQFDRVNAIVADTVAAGATLVTGGPGNGLFFKPTVLTGVTPDMRAFAEEIFGPVAAITIADDEAHAIALANQTDYGLSAAVQSGSLDRGQRVADQLHAGMVHVNDQTINDNFQAPMGGFGASGNGGRFSSLTAWEEFTEWQWKTASATPSRFPF